MTKCVIVSVGLALYNILFLALVVVVERYHILFYLVDHCSYLKYIDLKYRQWILFGFGLLLRDSVRLPANVKYDT